MAPGAVGSAGGPATISTRQDSWVLLDGQRSWGGAARCQLDGQRSWGGQLGVSWMDRGPGGGAAGCQLDWQSRVETPGVFTQQAPQRLIPKVGRTWEERSGQDMVWASLYVEAQPFWSAVTGRAWVWGPFP